MQFRIEHIDDVLPHIPSNVGIVVSERPEVRIIDYVFTNEATFATLMAQECRGLKFALDGTILARPLHKFFNIGEQQSATEIDWSQPHVVLDQRLHGALFAMLDGNDGREAVKRILTWASRSDPRMDSVRDLFDLRWDGTDLVFEQG